MLDFAELLIMREMNFVTQQQEQKILAMTKEIDDAEAYRQHVIKEIAGSLAVTECLPEEVIPEVTKRLETLPYLELKRLQWDYRLKTAMIHKCGNA